jgi:hypothetical protein
MFDHLTIEHAHHHVERLRADTATRALCAATATTATPATPATTDATATAPAPRRHAARLARALARSISRIADALDGRRTAAA